jgi:hypothetical protein
VPPPADGTCPFRPGRRAEVSPALEPTIVSESVGHLPRPHHPRADRTVPQAPPRRARPGNGEGQAQLDFAATPDQPATDTEIVDGGVAHNRVAGTCERCGARLAVGAGTVTHFGGREVLRCQPTCPPPPHGA